MEIIDELVEQIEQNKEEDLFNFEEKKDLNENETKKDILNHQDETQNSFIENELKKEDVQNLKIQTESYDWKEKHFPSFETIMELKQQYKNITLVEIGDKLEDSVFKIPPMLYILKPMPQTKYQLFITNVGAIAANLTKFTTYALKECVVFPEMDESDFEEIPIGVGDILINEIYKFSRFASTKKITRI